MSRQVEINNLIKVIEDSETDSNPFYDSGAMKLIAAHIIDSGIGTKARFKTHRKWSWHGALMGDTIMGIEPIEYP